MDADDDLHPDADLSSSDVEYPLGFGGVVLFKGQYIVQSVNQRTGSWRSLIVSISFNYAHPS